MDAPNLKRVSFALEDTIHDLDSVQSSEESNMPLRQRGVSDSVNCGGDSVFRTSRTAARILISMIYEAQSLLHEAGDSQLHANIVNFDDQNAGYEAGLISARDDTYYCADMDMYDPGKFFSRPVRIATFSWTVGTAFPGSRLQVFDLFWKNKHVINRLNNFRNMKCDMCVKIVVNGTPFHFGALMASATPDKINDNFLNTDLTELGCVRGSQNPHIFIDPTTSSAGCLRLPYSAVNNAYNTSGADITSAGDVTIRELVPLAHVSGLIEPVSISVFAWAENVVIGAPTFNNVAGLVAQSGDEYGTGIVSRPAFILAHLANSLSRVPFIRPYALATDMTATGIGNLAQLFGFVKPNVITDISFMNPRHLPNFSSATQHDPVFKSTFDDKSGVTVDSRVVGISGRDEMGIVDIAKRESYLVQFPYGQTTAIDTRLFNMRITPNMFRTGGTGVNTTYIQTPASWVSAPFQYWRGSMRIRFVAVCSAFHRGRLRIFYEPGANGSGVPLYNTNLSETWDIAKNKEMTIEVGWHQPFPYADNTTIVDASTPFWIGPTGGSNAANPINNGSLTVVVQNELTAPDTNLTSPIVILVYVSMCDDFEVFSPTNAIHAMSYFAQSGDIMKDITIEPYRREPDVIFGKRLQDDKSSIIFHGDPILSLRTLLKRYTWSGTWGCGSITAATPTRFFWKLNLPSFPLYNGRAANAVHTATSPINFTSMTFLNYYTPAFLARRGAVRHRFINGRSASVEHAFVTRTTSALYTNVFVAMNALTTASNLARQFVISRKGDTGMSGMNAVTNFDREPVDIEIPYHSSTRYYRARDASPNRVTVPNQGVTFACKFVAPNTGADVSVDHYVSAGDDFSLAYFIDVPIMYVHPVALLPVAT